MTQQMPFSNTKLDKAMTTEQFNQVVEAILAGKYSWACLLILRFAGYNPLHYIPYRTYNRLIKENCQGDRAKASLSDNTKIERSSLGDKGEDKQLSVKSLEQIKDLAYLEVVDRQRSKVKGGTIESCFNSDALYESQIVNEQPKPLIHIW